MEEAACKGTVTQLSSLFRAEEAQRASRRVHDTISKNVKELDQVRSFIGDNLTLINLVQKLPDHLHHEIMVPFGKAAFFPGRLIHTNEFLVLLGEGYYAERTSKQTIDILKRRGKTLEAQVESLKAVMQDLKAEAAFFDSTASEVSEGLVDIREDYILESSAHELHKSDSSMTAVVEDDEYAKMMARFDELEKEELAAEMNERDRDEKNSQVIHVDDPEEMEHPFDIANIKEENEGIKAYFEQKRSECSLDKKYKNYEGKLFNNESKQTKQGDKISKDLQNELNIGQDLWNQVESKPMQVAREDNSSCGRGLEPAKSTSGGNTYVIPGIRENVPVKSQMLNKEQTFTGSIVEHTHNLREPDSSSKSTSIATSKPVSRFKMQRR